MKNSFTAPNKLKDQIINPLIVIINTQNKVTPKGFLLLEKNHPIKLPNKSAKTTEANPVSSIYSVRVPLSGTTEIKTCQKNIVPPIRVSTAPKIAITPAIHQANIVLCYGKGKALVNTKRVVQKEL